MPTGRKNIFNGGRLLYLETINDSTATTVYTEPFVVGRSTVWALHLIYVGDPTATVVLQATCIPNPVLTDDVDWVDDSDVSFAGVAGSGTKELVEIGNSGASIYRLKIVTSAGDGTLDVYLSQKPRS